MTIGVPVLIWVMVLVYAFSESGIRLLGHCRASTMDCLLGRQPVCATSQTTIDTAGAQGGDVAARIVAYCRAQLGIPYVWAGPTNGSCASPNGFDCSGLVRCAVLTATGGKLNLPHNTVLQAAFLRAHAVSKNQSAWQPGDIVYYFIPGDSEPGHCAVYIGGGHVIAAPHSGTVVQIQPVGQGPGTHVMAVRRPAAAVPTHHGGHHHQAAPPARGQQHRRRAA